MEPAPDAPISLMRVAVGGLALVSLGVLLLARPAWLDAIHAAMGSWPAGRRERRVVPGCIIAAGAGWLFTWFAQVYPFYNGLKPLWIAFLSWIMPPAAAAVFVGVLAWAVILRRFVVRAGPSS
jgi:disulfide bond formation protein DsbB